MIETHHHAKKLLSRALKKGRPAHAYLIVGPAGAGKRTLARELAQALLCETRSFPPCRECGPCRRVALAKHPDLHLVERETKQIKIEQIRELTEKLRLHSFEGGTKVALCLDADDMRDVAQNAFLKTLEEPPPDTVLILTASGLSRILPTILSRCQVIRVGPLPEPVIRDLVIKERGLDEERARLIAGLSGGNAHRALDLEVEFIIDFRRQMLTEFLKLDPQNLQAILEFAEKLAGAGAEKDAGSDNRHDFILDMFTSFYRDVLRARLGIASLKNRDLAQPIGGIAARLSLPAILDRVTTVLNARSRLSGNANPRLTWEILTMSLADVPGAKLEAL